MTQTQFCQKKRDFLNSGGVWGLKVLINLFQQILMTVAAYKVKLAAYEARGAQG